MENTEKTEEIGIPEKNRVKRKYTMSPASLAQRKNAAKQPKGPGVARNAWKHGLFAKNYIQHKIRPCLTTCPQHPCELVEENETSPGGDCLDKKEVLQAYGVILKALQTKKLDDFNDLSAMILAETVQVLRNLLEDIQRTALDDIALASNETVRNLGVIFDPDLSLNSHLKLISRTAFFHLHNISKI